MRTAWINGVLTSNPSISANDRGFLYGDGVLETMLVSDGSPFRLDRHLERLAEGCRRMGIPAVEDLPQVVAQVLVANPGVPLAALRIIATRGEGNGLMPSAAPKPTVLVALSPYSPDPAWYERGLSAQVSGTRLDEEGPLVGLKHLGYLPAILALQASASSGAEEVIFLNRAEQVAEASASNLFCVIEGILRTPPLSAGILDGVTRSVVLELAHTQGIPVREEGIALVELMRAEEVFLTSSLRGLVPLRQIDAVPIGDGRPGPLFRAMRASYEELRASHA